jgi:hypothetical protein
MVQLMLDAGRAVDAADAEDGYTALHYAAFGGYAEVVRLLLGAGSAAAAAYEGCAALNDAAYAGHAEVVQLLLGAGIAIYAAFPKVSQHCTAQPDMDTPRWCGCCWARTAPFMPQMQKAGQLCTMQLQKAAPRWCGC